MMTTMPMPAGPAELPAAALPSERPLSGGDRTSGKGRDSFASTLDAARSKEGAANRAGRGPGHEDGGAKPARDDAPGPLTPVDSEAADPESREAAAAEGKPTPASAAMPSTSTPAAGTPEVRAMMEAPENGTSRAASAPARPPAADDLLRCMNRADTGKPAQVENAPKAAIAAGAAGAKEAAVKEVAGTEPAAASNGSSGGLTASSAGRGGEGVPEAGALLEEAAGKKTPEGERQPKAGPVGDKASTRAAVQPQTEQTTGERAFSDTAGSGDKAHRQDAKRTQGGETAALQAKTGAAENEGREASARPVQSGERPGENAKSFGEAVRENIASPAKDDAGTMAPRQSAPDASPVFSLPSAGPKTAAAAAGGATAGNPAAATAESFAQDNFHQLVERALFTVKGGQSEARIALKPEHMGHVRMQIVTENQAVTIRIVTESPVARDLIDANAHQLRSELQQQGLNVQSIEVAVSDGDQDAYRGARQREAFLRHMAAQGEASATEDAAPSPAPGSADRTAGRRTAGIDFFA